MRFSARLALTGKLSTEDRDTAIIRIWPDADLAGDPLEDAKSTSGSWIEVASVIDDNRSMPIHWSANKQGGVADSTTVAELDAMHGTLKTDGLPIAALLEFLLGRPVHVEVMEDNTTTMAAANAGYSPKLRYLHRTRRIDLEWLKEVFDDERHKLVYTESAKQKGDLMTKEFSKPEFEQRKHMLGIGAVIMNAACASAWKMLDGELQHIGTSLAAAPGYMGASPAAATDNPEQPEDKKDIQNPGRDSWVIDTGSGYHLLGKRDLTDTERDAQRETVERLHLHTANGRCSANQVTDTVIRELGNMECEVRVLEKTPRVLSVGQLVENGAEFWWNQDGPRLRWQGAEHRLQVYKGVPLLAVPALTQ
jgi:hypothetical protein